MPILMVSPVGTSLITNRPIEEHVLNTVLSAANKSEEELTEEEKHVITARVQEVERMLASADDEGWKRRSAEMNGILSYRSPTERDQHFLISTDTFQGRRTAELVQAGLRQRFGCTAEVFTPPKLSTRDTFHFSRGMVEFTKWCHETLPGYKGSGYKIVFNLTGGFKSVQGFMSVLAMVYADEIVYVFETGELIKIPRLPIELCAEDVARRGAVAFEFLYTNGLSKSSLVDISTLPETMVEIEDIDGEQYAALNTWGTLVWQENRKRVLGGELIDWPKLEYERSFREDFEGFRDSNVRVAIQEALAKASYLLMPGEGVGPLRRDGGLLYEDYEDRKPEGHFRVNRGIRVSCVPEGDGLILLRVGSHDVVNP